MGMQVQQLAVTKPPKEQATPLEQARQASGLEIRQDGEIST